MKTYPTSNDAARMTHAAWDAAPPCPDPEEESRIARYRKMSQRWEREHARRSEP